MLALVMIVNLIYLLLRDVWGGLPSAWRTIELVDGNAKLTSRKGTVCTGRLLPSTLIYPLCLILRVQCDNGSAGVSVVLFRDAIGANDFRKLAIQTRFLG